MMSSKEPDLRGFGGAAAPLDEEGLRKLMSDKRYWRDHDPAVVRAVSEGFNSRIQSIKSVARGFRNFDNYRTRILFFCGKLDLTLENP
jgi:hypothetical protein